MAVAFGIGGECRHIEGPSTSFSFFFFLVASSLSHTPLFLIETVIGVVGLLASDYLERRMPAANEGAHVEGRRKPRLLGISVVDRDEKQQMV